MKCEYGCVITFRTAILHDIFLCLKTRNSTLPEGDIKRDNKMGKADRISGIFWLIFSMVVSFESYNLGLGTLRKPGPGFFFFLTGIILGIMSLTIVIKSWKYKKIGTGRESVLGKLSIIKIIQVLASLFLYALLMEKLGFLLITFLLFIFLLKVVEKKNWSLTIFFSLLVTVITYLIFEIGLTSQLPKGVLYYLRF